jgi:hypothetical protein
MIVGSTWNLSQHILKYEIRKNILVLQCQIFLMVVPYNNYIFQAHKFKVFAHSLITHVFGGMKNDFISGSRNSYIPYF